tara:strand:+ start:5288 stop:5896 length:609 start_codon:yes stop_codon:yes gene_type:complete
MQKLVNGYFQFKESGFKERKDLFENLSNSQNPEVLFITCSDSRIDPNLITQTEPGDLFVIRNAGNIVPPHTAEFDGIVASVEFAVVGLGVKHIVVCGHSNCGAMKGALNTSGLTALPKVKDWLNYCSEAVTVAQSKKGDSKSDELHSLTQENVLLQIRRLKQYPEISKRLTEGNIEIHGWVYEIGDGAIKYFDHEKHSFIEL